MIPTLLTHGNHNACYHNRKGTSLPFYGSFTNSKSLQFKIISAYDELINMCIARAECDGTHAETRFRLSPKRTGPFKSLGGVSSVNYWQPRCAHQLGYCWIHHVRRWRESTGYPLHSPVSPSLPLPCVAVCHQVPNELYNGMSGIILQFV